MNDFDIISSTSQFWYHFFCVGRGGGGGGERGGGGGGGGWGVEGLGEGTLMQRTSEFLLCICE